MEEKFTLPSNPNANGSNSSMGDIACPMFTVENEDTLNLVSLWVEGIVGCCIAIPGVFGNISSAFVLLQKDMRNSFNLLLIALACFDNLYLFGGILEAIRKHFDLVTHAHIILFPYLFYPLQAMAMTGSVFMTVAIALERYVAVHYPINYSQSMNDGNALRQRMFKYLIPVICLTVIFNLTKFFEATYDYDPETTLTLMDGVMINETRFIPVLKTTELRTDPDYSIYFNWFRFVVIGVIPFALLVLFNTKIYTDIKERQRRSAGFKRAQTSTATMSKTGVSVCAARTCQLTPLVERKLLKKATETSMDRENGDNNKKIMPDENTVLVMAGNDQETPDGGGSLSSASSTPVINTDRLAVGRISKLKLKKTISANSGTEQISLTTENNGKLTIDGDDNKSSIRTSKNSVQRLFSSSSNSKSRHLSEEIEMVSNQTGGLADQDEGITLTVIKVGKTSRISSFLRKNQGNPKMLTLPDAPSTISVNAKRRYMEDHLATIFMMYIMVFLVCHLPRIMLNIYELAVIRLAVECISRDERPFPLWANYVTCLSQFMLIVNSSINIIIYCALSSKFRDECTRILGHIWQRCRHTPHHI